MSNLLVDDSDGVRTLTLNRPERKNALSPELVQTMEAALKAADADSAVRCIVLTGAGEGDKAAFCAGGDLAGGMTGDGFFEQHLARGAFAELLLTMHRLRTPTIAAVNGHALGGGFGLVLACDLAVAADDARLGTPEVKRGLFPMMISALIDEVLRRAGVVLASGRPAIIDASFRTAAGRSAARDLASRHNVPFRFVECQAPLEVARDRMARPDGTIVSR